MGFFIFMTIFMGGIITYFLYIGQPDYKTKVNGFKVSTKHYEEFHDDQVDVRDRTKYKLIFPEPLKFDFTIIRSRYSSFKNNYKIYGYKSLSNLNITSKDELRMTALLNTRVISMLLKFQYEFQIDQNKISCTVYTSESIPGSQFTISKIVDLASAITSAPLNSNALLTNYAQEKYSEIGARNLLCLFKYFPKYLEQKDLVSFAVENDDPMLKFFIFKTIQKKQTLQNLKSIWKKSPDIQKLEILEYLIHEKDNRFNDFFVKNYNTSSTKIKRNILKLFEQTGVKDVNDFLILQLKIKKHKLLKGTIKALATCGCINAVEPLLNVKSMLLQKDVKKSITQIQYRLSGREPGALSLNSSKLASGELSLNSLENKGNLNISEQLFYDRQTRKKP